MVNLVYPIHNGSCHKQQMINNDKLKSWETAVTIMNWFLKWNVLLALSECLFTLDLCMCWNHVIL
jgi:hypothetical protein